MPKKISGNISDWRVITTNPVDKTFDKITLNDITDIINVLQKMHNWDVWLQRIDEMINHVGNMKNPHQLIMKNVQENIIDRLYLVWLEEGNRGTKREFEDQIFYYYLIADEPIMRIGRDLEHITPVKIVADYLEYAHNVLLPEVLHVEWTKYGYIENATLNDNKLIMSGWAFDIHNKDNGEIYVFIDWKYYKCEKRIKRQDIADKYGQQYLDSGWEISIPLNEACTQLGRYPIVIIILNKFKNHAYIFQSKDSESTITQVEMKEYMHFISDNSHTDTHEFYRKYFVDKETINITTLVLYRSKYKIELMPSSTMFDINLFYKNVVHPKSLRFFNYAPINMDPSFSLHYITGKLNNSYNDTSWFNQYEGTFIFHAKLALKVVEKPEEPDYEVPVTEYIPWLFDKSKTDVHEFYNTYLIDKSKLDVRRFQVGKDSAGDRLWSLYFSKYRYEKSISNSNSYFELFRLENTDTQSALILDANSFNIVKATLKVNGEIIQQAYALFPNLKWVYRFAIRYKPYSLDIIIPNTKFTVFSFTHASVHNLMPAFDSWNLKSKLISPISNVLGVHHLMYYPKFIENNRQLMVWLFSDYNDLMYPELDLTWDDYLMLQDRMKLLLWDLAGTTIVPETYWDYWPTDRNGNPIP